MKSLSDTITAISTPHGPGGIGIIRLSGPESLSIAKKIFSPTIKNKPVQSHHVMHGYIVNPINGIKVDEVLLTFMLAPKTFTTEDVVEISCHGGFSNTNRILNLTIDAGARLAGPGEFTKRAFLNGRINLLQAEGIRDIINSKSQVGNDAAFSLIDNVLFQRVEALKKRLFSIAMEVESEIDFSEEDIETQGERSWLKGLEEVVAELDKLIHSFERGKIIRDGIRVAIAGKPNVGKSSLMNALLNEDRAIVSNAPGTTRDTIEESLSVNGISIRLTDTAGLQHSKNPVENEGMKRSKLEIKRADMLLVVFDGSQKLDQDDQKVLKLAAAENLCCFFVINKVDKRRVIDFQKIEMIQGCSFFSVSAKTGEGVEALLNGITKDVLQGDGEPSGDRELFITGKRHYDLLVRTRAVLKRGVAVLEKSLSIDMLAEEIKGGISILSELSGENYSDEILDRIFNEFCIGK